METTITENVMSDNVYCEKQRANAGTRQRGKDTGAEQPGQIGELS